MREHRLRLWNYLANFWTIIFFLGIILDFIYTNQFSSTLNVMAFVYVGILAIYVGKKEFERWYHKHRHKHPGELFVLFWTLLIVSIYALNLILSKGYEMPAAVISSYLAVLTILAITERSKIIYHQKKQQK